MTKKGKKITQSSFERKEVSKQEGASSVLFFSPAKRHNILLPDFYLILFRRLQIYCTKRRVKVHIIKKYANVKKERETVNRRDIA